MKNSLIFSSMETVLTRLEELIDDWRDNLKYRITEYETAKNDEYDDWVIESRKESVDQAEMIITLYEHMYNDVYMNFQKILK